MPGPVVSIRNRPFDLAPGQRRTGRPREMLGEKDATQDLLIFLAASATNKKVLLNPVGKLAF
jgi:hypothetical protein